jgi:hypothetical protein
MRESPEFRRYSLRESEKDQGWFEIDSEKSGECGKGISGDTLLLTGKIGERVVASGIPEHTRRFSLRM